MWPAAYAVAPQSGRARSKRQSIGITSAPIGLDLGCTRWSNSASSEVSISVVFMGGLVSARVAYRYNRHSALWRENDGDRRLLGKRQPIRLACAAGARAQGAGIQQPRPP